MRYLMAAVLLLGCFTLAKLALPRTSALHRTHSNELGLSPVEEDAYRQDGDAPIPRRSDLYEMRIDDDDLDLILGGWGFGG
jgi:hypothetical protein